MWFGQKRQLLRVLPAQAVQLYGELQESQHPHGRRALRTPGEGATGMRVPMKQVWIIYVVIYLLLYTDIW